jgi:glycosyltransferase involved in cell wall biosynthesis
LCYFGGVARHKGVEVLVDAFARATRAGLRRKVELHVHGREATPEFAARLDALGAGTPFYRHGAYAHATLARVAVHAAVFPSLAFETFGFVLDEAFELGLPVLVSDLGALSHRAGAAALRVPAGDVDAWQQAITALARDPAPLAALAANIPPPPPDWDAHLRALATIYAQALGTERRSAPLVPASRRVAFLLRQRESALARLTPPGGPD